MHFRSVAALAGALSAASAIGCASQKASTENKSATAADQKAAAAAVSEREDFVKGAREWLDELNDRIIVLAVKVHDDGDEAQIEEWGELLFQLRQERNRLDAALIDVRDVETPGGGDAATRSKAESEWQARRAVLHADLLRLETAINRTTVALAHELAGGERSAEADPSSGAVDVDLCEVQVSGTDAEVLQEGDMVIVHLSAADPAAVEALQARTEEQLRTASSSPQPASPDAAGDEPQQPAPDASAANLANLPAAELHVAATPDGVVFIFAPRAGELAELKAQLERAAEQIEKRRC